MAVDNFFVTIKVKKEDYDFLVSKHNLLDKHNYYQTRLRIDYSENQNELCLIGCLATFINSTIVLYEFCKEMNLTNEQIEIGRMKTISLDDLSQNEFVTIMYQVYEDKLNSFNNAIGMFIVKPDEEFYKFRRRNKKHFKN